MRPLLAVVAFTLSAALASPAAAAAPSCGAPLKLDDGWGIQSDAADAGFAPRALCEVVRSFEGSPRNLHALVVERHGNLVTEA
jgi:hypothetical protein